MIYNGAPHAHINAHHPMITKLCILRARDVHLFEGNVKQVQKMSFLLGIGSSIPRGEKIGDIKMSL